MASQDKDTPKKLYRKEKSSGSILRCRLCNSVTFSKHNKGLFRVQNEDILRSRRCPPLAPPYMNG